MPLVEGMLVEVVEPGSPAQKAGIRGGAMELYLGGNSLLLGGDIIVSINDTSTVHPEKFTETMHALAVGAKARIKLYRDGEFKEVEYELPERPLLPGDLSENGGLEALAMRLRGSLPGRPGPTNPPPATRK
jgi:putative serine protease PepD